MNLNTENLSFYKYKSIKDFVHFVDIVLNCRLFASYYPHLNDPMEGHYYYDQNKLHRDVIDLIKCKKNSLRVCRLSKRCDDPLMWSHYADGNQGVMIKIKVLDNQPIPITYSAKLPRLNVVDNPKETAKNVLSQKGKAWCYESEYRVFTTSGSLYIPIKLEKVVLGSRMQKEQETLIRELVQKLNKNVTVEVSEIGVIKR